jgi:hypothetical protein
MTVPPRPAARTDPRMAAAENPMLPESITGPGRCAVAERRPRPGARQAVIEVESGQDASAVSSRERGLMRVLPETAAWLGFPESADPAVSLEAGCPTSAARRLRRRCQAALAACAGLARCAAGANPAAVDSGLRVPGGGEVIAASRWRWGRSQAGDLTVLRRRLVFGLVVALDQVVKFLIPRPGPFRAAAALTRRR